VSTLVAGATWVGGLLLLAIALLAPVSGGPTDLVGVTVSVLALLLGILPTITVGTILVMRLPRHPIGWLLLACGLLLALNAAVSNLADDGLNVHPGSVPGAIWFAWLSQWVSLPFTVVLLVYLPLLFPTGRLPSHRWRLVAVAGVVALVFAVAQNALIPFPVGTFPPAIQNPLVVSGSALDLALAVGVWGWMILVVTVPLALASLVVRYRHGSGIEREQLKWFAAVLALAGPALVIGALTNNATSGVGVEVSTDAFAVSGFGMALLPVAIGIAVLRYRLYDIDLVIRRTLVYGALALLLAVAYGGSVLLLSALLAPLTAENSLAVAGSTLVVAALFSPVRNRVRSIVDRRFYRSRYDATRELADLSQRLRGEVDLDGVKAEVVATIGRTLQPTSASIWLRAEGNGSRTT